jgi:hypothetical protein
MSFLGITHSPNYEIVGSLFPAWMIAVIVGIILMVIVRAIIYRTGLASYVRPPFLVYLSMALTFTFLVWLVLS